MFKGFGVDHTHSYKVSENIVMGAPKSAIISSFMSPMYTSQTGPLTGGESSASTSRVRSTLAKSCGKEHSSETEEISRAQTLVTVPELLHTPEKGPILWHFVKKNYQWQGKQDYYLDGCWIHI